ncbi:MAG: ABC transporter ATP-binding protein [Lachnospiraceae bacterium]|nr:ABC transporter ATP-binding protein [Lachnospiraceae bacterium]
MSYIQLDNLTVEYNIIKRKRKNTDESPSKKIALNNINLSLENGDFIAIMGKSGCGKTTLLNVIGTLLKPSAGDFYYNDILVNNLNEKALSDYRNSEVGFVVQHYALVDDMTVYDNIALPLSFRHISKKEIKERVSSLLNKLDISDKALNYPFELSGGEKQRVAIARALINNPSLILADEPTGALDEATGKEVMNLLKSLNKKGITIILATHDSDVASYANKILRMRDGSFI